MANQPIIMKEQYLGEIESSIVGLQYYDAEIKPGERVTLKREPDNPHDRDAIRVENRDFNKIGHLPRKLVSWLTPLIDIGKIRIEGTVPMVDGHEIHHTCPLDLQVYLCEKGYDILQPGLTMLNHRDALHEVIRVAFADIAERCEPDTAVKLAEQLWNAVKLDALPDTHLLLSLLPSVAKQACLKKSAASAAFQEGARDTRMDQENQELTMNFTMQRGRWYACKLFGPFFDQCFPEKGCSYSPIKILKIVESGKEDGVIHLSFYHANYPEGVRDKTYQLQIAEQRKESMVARSIDHPDERFLEICEIDRRWIMKHFERIVPESEDIQTWLDHNM